ncbi:hypothetical protein [Algivirga pacifica]|uniref:Tetratricopeptide repeat-containing protein n=1 Tax=Algivirga pacifica TaxID=1162670 RepID=A0ABP9DBL7_9BACT
MNKQLQTILFLVILLYGSSFSTALAQRITQKHPQEGMTSVITLKQNPKYKSPQPRVKAYTANIQFNIEQQQSTSKRYRAFTLSPSKLEDISFILSKKGYSSFRKSLKYLQGSTVTYNVKDTLAIHQLSLKVERVKANYRTEGNITEENVDQYYQLGEQYKQLQQKLSGMKLSDPEAYTKNHNTIEEAEGTLNDMKEVAGLLPLQQTDPVRLRGSISTLEKQLQAHRQTLISIQKDLHLLYYEKGMQAHSEALLKQAHQTAQQKRIPFPDPLVALAELAYQKNDYQRSIDYIQKASAMSMTPALKSKSQQLYQRIYQYYVNRGKQTANIEQAAKWYYLALDMKTPRIPLKTEEAGRQLQERRSEALDDMIANGIQERDFNLLEQAEKYHQTYQKETTLPEEYVTEAYQHIYDEDYIAEARRLSLKAQYPKAYRKLVELEKLSKKLEVPVEGGMSPAYKRLYLSLYRSGKKSQENRDYEGALSRYEFCQQIIDKHRIRVDEQALSAEMRICYQGIFQQELNKALALIQQKRFEQAEQSIASVENYYDKHEQWMQSKEQSALYELKRTFYTAQFNHSEQEVLTFLRLKAFDKAKEAMELMLSIGKNQEYPINTPNKTRIMILRQQSYYTAFVDHQIQLSRGELTQNQPGQAMDALVLAQQEFENGKQWVSNRSNTLINLRKQVQLRLLSEGYRLLESNLDQAQVYTEKASLLPAANRQITQLTKRNQGYVALHIGQRHIEEKEYLQALSSFTEARAVKANISALDQALSTQEQKAMQLFYTQENLVLLSMLDFNEEGRVSDNTLKQVELRLWDLRDLSKKYQYSPNSTQLKQKTTIEQRMAEAVCLNRTDDYQQMLQDAEAKIFKDQYAYAGDLLDQALSLTQQYQECGMDSTKAQQLLSRYQYAITYQRERLAIESLIEEGLFNKATEQYISLKDYYQKHELFRRGLEHPTPKTYFVKHKNVAFLRSNTLYYAADHKEKSLFNALLKELMHREQEESFYYSLGMEMALLHKNHYKGMSSKKAFSTIKPVKSGFLWFKHRNFKRFKKGYFGG